MLVTIKLQAFGTDTCTRSKIKILNPKNGGLEGVCFTFHFGVFFLVPNLVFRGSIVFACPSDQLGLLSEKCLCNTLLFFFCVRVGGWLFLDNYAFWVVFSVYI